MVAGLVAITPGSGFVPAWSAVIFGIVGASAANFGTKLKFMIGIDDALDIFAVHAIGGLAGNICTAFFAADYIAHLDGMTVIQGGWLNGHWIQMGYQLCDSLTGGLYSFFGSLAILWVLDSTPGLALRVDEEDEIRGIDDCEIGEFAYDYVDITREVLNVDAPSPEPVEKISLDQRMADHVLNVEDLSRNNFRNSHNNLKNSHNNLKNSQNNLKKSVDQVRTSQAVNENSDNDGDGDTYAYTEDVV